MRLSILFKDEFIVQGTRQYQESILAVIARIRDGTRKAENARRDTVSASVSILLVKFILNEDALISWNEREEGRTGFSGVRHGL
jgi:hypothetical protein